MVFWSVLSSCMLANLSYYILTWIFITMTISTADTHNIQCADCADDCSNPGICMTEGKCFIRRDVNGIIYRGCADHIRWQGLHTGYTGCLEQEYLGWNNNRPLWCLCGTDQCNAVDINSLATTTPASIVQTDISQEELDSIASEAGVNAGLNKDDIIKFNISFILPPDKPVTSVPQNDVRETSLPHNDVRVTSLPNQEASVTFLPSIPVHNPNHWNISGKFPMLQGSLVHMLPTFPPLSLQKEDSDISHDGSTDPKKTIRDNSEVDASEPQNNEQRNEFSKNDTTTATPTEYSDYSGVNRADSEHISADIPTTLSEILAGRTHRPPTRHSLTHKPAVQVTLGYSQVTPGNTQVTPDNPKPTILGNIPTISKPRDSTTDSDFVDIKDFMKSHNIRLLNHGAGTRKITPTNNSQNPPTADSNGVSEDIDEGMELNKSSEKYSKVARLPNRTSTLATMRPPSTPLYPLYPGIPSDKTHSPGPDSTNNPRTFESGLSGDYTLPQHPTGGNYAWDGVMDTDYPYFNWDDMNELSTPTESSRNIPDYVINNADVINKGPASSSRQLNDQEIIDRLNTETDLLGRMTHHTFSTTTTSTHTIRSATSCPESFEVSPDNRSCYSFVRKRHTPLEAADYCTSLHPAAHLASLSTHDEYRWVMMKISMQEALHEGWQGWWTSGVYDTQIREYIWASTGYVISRLDTRWHKPLLQEPFPGTCVWLVPLAGHTLGNYGCNQKSGFICKVHLATHM